MTLDEIKALKELEAKATEIIPGSWENFGALPGKRAPVGVVDDKHNVRVCDVGDHGMTVEQILTLANLIASARNNLPALLAIAEAAIEFTRETHGSGLRAEMDDGEQVAFDKLLVAIEGSKS